MKPVTLTRPCPHCHGKIIGMGHTKEQAQARLNYNYTDHIAVCVVMEKTTK